MNTVELASTTRWDSIFQHPNMYIASRNSPAPYGVPLSRWVMNLGLAGNARYTGSNATFNLISDIYDGLVAGAAMVMVDELNLNTQQLIAETAGYLGDPIHGGVYHGRWGAYVLNGGGVDYRNLATGLGWLCYASARISCEFYVYLKRGPVDASTFNYIGGGTSSTARDQWAGEYFRGPVRSDSDGRGTRLQYLMDVRAVYNALYGSAPIVVPIFGATDRHLKSAQPGDPDANDIVAIRMLDRLLYAFRNFSGYGSLLFGSNGGGAGSWKWELPGLEGSDPDPTLGQPTTGSRDLEMALSYGHYCQPPYHAGSRRGPVL